MADTLIYNVDVVTPSGTLRGAYVILDQGYILSVGQGYPCCYHARTSVDGHGGTLLPGLIDAHVHFRQPGLEQKGDIATESRAAVAGGVTSFLDMPNTLPPTVTPEDVEHKAVLAAQTSVANYGFFIGATADNTDTLLRADYSGIAGIKLFLGSSTGGMLLNDDDTIRRLLAGAPAPVAVHAESEDIIAANRSAATAAYGPDPDVAHHSEIRSRRACVEAAAHIVVLARQTGARLHLCHISTAEELMLLDNDLFPNITGETCPQYLLFTDADYARLGTRIKCNPAIKAATDALALRRAVESGLIATIATDHAPHLLADKQGGALRAASGMPGVQFMLPLLLTAGFTPELIARACAQRPAQIYGITGRGSIAPGHHADLTLVHTLQHPHTIADADALSRCAWTPYAGRQLSWQVSATWVGGTLAYTAADGVRPDVRGSRLAFNN